MKEFSRDGIPVAWGTWEDAAALRRWSFLQRTPQQRLDWLVEALKVAYQSGAIKPRRPGESSDDPVPRHGNYDESR